MEEQGHEELLEKCYRSCLELAESERWYSMFFNRQIIKSTGNYSEQIKKLQNEIANTDTIIIGAGAGLSTSAGFTYSGERFQKYFSDFAARYHFADMYSGGFYPYQTLEEYWAYWSRYIYINRYMDAPKPIHVELLEIVKQKDYFVLTTNVDHLFQKAGFDKHRLFYTQGDYGLWQCRDGCEKKTYDNEEQVRKMLEAQGFEMMPEGELVLPEGVIAKTSILSELIPYCPECGKPLTMNLRCDGTFVQDKGWDMAAQRYSDFLRRHESGHVLYLELGVGANTPVIIKYPFWRRVQENQRAIYACINYGEAYTSKEIAERSVLIDGDIYEIIEYL